MKIKKKLIVNRKNFILQIKSMKIKERIYNIKVCFNYRKKQFKDEAKNIKESKKNINIKK